MQIFSLQRSEDYWTAVEKPLISMVKQYYRKPLEGPNGVLWGQGIPVRFEAGARNRAGPLGCRTRANRRIRIGSSSDLFAVVMILVLDEAT